MIDSTHSPNRQGRTRRLAPRSRIRSKFAAATTAALAVTLGIATQTMASGPWIAQTSGFSGSLSGVSFIDASHGWVAGDNGRVLATADGGATWSAETTNVNKSLHSVTFVDATHGWAVGEFGAIIATTDGGATWSTQVSGSTTQEYLGVTFTDVNHGWAVGFDGVILATADGGTTWTPQTSGSTQTLFAASFLDATHGWVVGTFGTVLSTSDGGASWGAGTVGTGALNAVAFTDPNHGWATGDDGTIIGTADGGADWTTEASGTANRMFGISFADSDHGWAVGDSGTIVATTDGGTTWTSQTSGTADFLIGVSFADANHGWAVGGHGRILHFVSTPPAGSMTVSAASGAPGGVISASSVTPCPSGSESVAIALKNSGDVTVASVTASSFDSSRNWAGSLTIPAGATPGSYFVTANCFRPSTRVPTDTQNYNFSALLVTSPAPLTGTLRGRSFTLRSAQLARVAVTLDGTTRHMTGSAGGYLFSGVVSGSHTVSATFNGHACHANSNTGATAPISVVVAGGAATYVNWYCQNK